jgi:FKBP-type peptidyl-prolyl cis-trans isomerase FkpA
MKRHVVIAGAVLFAAGCSSNSTPTSPSVVVPFTTVDLVAGTGPGAVFGNTLTIDYTVWLYNASKTDLKGIQVQTSAGQAPYTFQLGAGSVIYGLDIGLQGLKVGGTRRLIIPSTFAYGSQGSGGIPPNSAIVFEVTLDSIQ